MQDTPVIFQGTFDPFTNGHLAIVKEALVLFGAVRILLLVNPDKTPLFSVEERKQMILQSTAGLNGISVDSSEGWLVDYMQVHHLPACVRGVRNGEDAAYELHNHQLSAQMYPAITTFLLPCPSDLCAVSSSAVKTACEQGCLPAGWVPQPVQQKLLEKYTAVKIS